MRETQGTHQPGCARHENGSASPLYLLSRQSKESQRASRATKPFAGEPSERLCIPEAGAYEYEITLHREPSRREVRDESKNAGYRQGAAFI